MSLQSYIADGFSRLVSAINAVNAKCGVVSGNTFCGMPVVVDSYGKTIGTHPAFKRIINIRISNSINYLGRGAYNIGTLVSKVPNTTSISAAMRRASLSTTATAGSAVGWGSNSGEVSGIRTGGSNGLFGFFHSCLFVPSCVAAVTGHRWFVGLYSSGYNTTNTDYSTLIGKIGLIKMATSSNIFLSWGGTSAQVPLDLGINFPADGLSTDAYRFSVYVPPTMSDGFYYRVERLGTTYIAEGLITDTPTIYIPAQSTNFSHIVSINNNATAAIASIDIGNVYTEVQW